MDTKKVIVQVFASLILLAIFLFPIWQITLVAPQYPHGVTLFIWLDKLTGDTPGTIQNINILNHYVGMQYIDQESIPELVYFPYVIISFCVLGLIAALSRKRWLVFTWVALLILGAVLGMYDFYLWEYDYGHNLDPTAPITFEGQAYQPPLIGEKYLLNFLAKSYPHVGTGFYVLSMILGSWVFWKSKK